MNRHIKIKSKKSMVSIIIPSYNRREDLDICITSIFKQSYKHKEVILVDDNSSDDSVVYIKKKFPIVRIFVNSKNKGPNYSINRGISNSLGEYILVLDSDVKMTNKNHIHNMVKIASSDKNIGSIGGSFIPGDPRTRSCGLRKVVFFDEKVSNIRKYGCSLMECDWVGTNNMFVKKKRLLETGGLDESIKGDWNETEFGLNLKQKGYVNLFGPDIALKHFHSETERDNIGIQLNTKKESEKARVRSLCKNRQRLRYVIKNYQIIKNKRKLIKNILWEYTSLPSNIISVLAFIKQQFFGMRKGDNLEKMSFKKKIKILSSKIKRCFLSIRFPFDAVFWNLFHLRETIRSRKTNFLENHE
ncbi:glycosyltransferase [Candidatus Woesearchaeota archaeon]|nr:glycosyltransferase [Candidatus Woesearchaeota archaeon]